MKIRPAGGNLDEAMNKVKEFNSFKDLMNYLKSEFSNIFNLDTLSCEFYTYDQRIDWNTFILCADTDESKQQAIVFADSPLTSFSDYKEE